MRILILSNRRQGACCLYRDLFIPCDLFALKLLIMYRGEYVFPFSNCRNVEHELMRYFCKLTNVMMNVRIKCVMHFTLCIIHVVRFFFLSFLGNAEVCSQLIFFKSNEKKNIFKSASNVLCIFIWFKFYICIFCWL